VPLSPASWRAFGHRYVIALVVTFVLVTGGIIGANVVIDNRLSDIQRVGGLELPEGPAEAGNYLIVGSDARDPNASEAAVKAFGTEADAGPPKSDTLMIVHIDPDAKKSLLVSFPRDLLVDIPGKGRGQINAAYNDGQQKVIDTIQENFGIDVNHYVEVNFEAFVGIVDAIGKIPVYFSAPARDDYSGLNILNPGCQELDGTQALEYVRSRSLQYYDSQSGEWTDASPRADLDRITRQQNFIRRLASAAAGKAGSNPLAAYEIAEAVIPKLKIDDQLSKEDIFRLINTFRKVNPEDDSAMEMITIPNEPAPDGNRVVLKQPDAAQVLARLRTFGGAQEDDGVDPDLLPSQVRVRVLNGTGINQLASNTLTSLQDFSFAPAGVGDTSTLSATRVHYRPGHVDDAKLVARYLGGVGRLVADDSIRDTDVVVMLGRDFDGVVPPPGAKTPATTAGSTSSAGSGSSGSSSGNSGSAPKEQSPESTC
jgi:LCP family protein required for cell wall assembly